MLKWEKGNKIAKLKKKEIARREKGEIKQLEGKKGHKMAKREIRKSNG